LFLGRSGEIKNLRHSSVAIAFFTSNRSRERSAHKRRKKERSPMFTLTLKSLSLVSLSILLAACSGTTAPETAQSSSAVHANEPVADITGTYVFDLEHSEVAGPIKQDCALKANGDAAKQAACYNEVNEEAGREKIRFSKLPEGGRSLYTSFGVEPNKTEIVWLEVPLELASDGPGHVLAKVAGPANGPHAAQFGKSNINTLRIEVINAKSIAMTDPKKGRLVFNKE
jgi:hypothetical protein